MLSRATASKYSYALTDSETPVGQFLRRFWQPIYLSAKLQSGWTVPVRVMGQNFKVAQLGQGVIADKSNEHLGDADAAIVLLRSIFDRELNALEHGLPLKQWSPTVPRPTSGAEAVRP
jgi:hypothetical protein